MNNLKLFSFIEKLWILGIIIGIVGCVSFLILKDNDSALFFFGFFIISCVSYYMRRYQRKKEEKTQEQLKEQQVKEKMKKKVS
jgi:uncharacterized membrane protein YfcA